MIYAQTMTIKKDAQGRPYFIDKDNDTIIILDIQTRKELKDINALKEDFSKNIVDQKSFFKASNQNKSLEESKPKYEFYTVEEGDTWESISSKLYGTKEFWAQLKLWNQELLIDLNLPVGKTVKYLKRTD